MASDSVFEERKKRIWDRIHYWTDVRRSAIPGGHVDKWAGERILLLMDAIKAIEKEERSHEEKSENHMGAVGRSK